MSFDPRGGLNFPGGIKLSELLSSKKTGVMRESSSRPPAQAGIIPLDQQIEAFVVRTFRLVPFVPGMQAASRTDNAVSFVFGTPAASRTDDEELS